MDGNNPKKEKDEREDRVVSSCKGYDRYRTSSYAGGREEFCEFRDIFSFDAAAVQDRMEIDDDEVVDYLWSHHQNHSIGRTIINQNPAPLTTSPIEVGNETDSVIVRKFKDKPIRQRPPPPRAKHVYCMEYRESYRLIKDPHRRKVLLISLLLVLLPPAYLAGLYVGDAYFQSNKLEATTFQHGPQNANADAADKENEKHINIESLDQESVEQMEVSPHPTRPLTDFPSVISNSDEAMDNVAPQSPVFPPTVASRTPLPTPSPVQESPWGDITWKEVPKSGTHSLSSGPLVGHTTYHSSKLWAVQADGKVMQLLYYPSVEDSSNIGETTTTGNIMARVVQMVPNPSQNYASIVEIGSLEPNKIYKYEIRIANEWIAKGQFKTAPLHSGGGVEFTYLLASCIDVKRRSYPVQPVWDVIRRIKQPDFAILAGDNVYLNDEDWTSEGEILLGRVFYRNFQQRYELFFADFIANTPIYSTWDDHEYGLNNANRHQLGKDNSLRAFQHLWANPSYGTQSIPGVFYSYMWGGVEFFVMDNRWYREDGGSRSQFGHAQKEWLYHNLKQSTATFKIIVSGSDVMARGRDIDVREIGSVVTENQISGVLFNAGDIHRNEFKTAYYESWPYPVTQISSSGIARVWRRPFALINVNTQLDDPTVTVSFYGANSTSLDTMMWFNDPNLICSNVAFGDLYNEHRCTQVIRLSDLSIS